MKILVVTNLFPPEYVGGYELRCAHVAWALAARGHEVRVLTSEAGVTGEPASPTAAPSDGNSGSTQVVDVERSLGHYRQAPPRSWPYTLAFGRRQLMDCGRFAQLLDEFEPDVVAWWNMEGLTKALLALPATRSIPDVCFVEDSWMITEFGTSGETEAFHWFDFWRGEWGPSALRPLVKLVMGRWQRRASANGTPTAPFRLDPSHVSFVSEFLRFEHRKAGLSLRSTEVVYGGIQSGQFEARRAPSEFAERPLRLLYVGYLSRDRGLHNIVDAIGLLDEEERRNVRLSIHYGGPVRDSDYSREVKLRVNELGLTDSVEFLGRVPHEDMSTVYRRHHVLVFPSMRGEGLPLTIMEAMASGAAVVTTGSGGAMEIADRADLPVFPKDHPVALARLIGRLLREPEVLVELAERGQRLVLTEFTLDRMVDRIERSLHSLTDRQAAHEPEPASFGTSEIS